MGGDTGWPRGKGFGLGERLVYGEKGRWNSSEWSESDGEIFFESER